MVFATLGTDRAMRKETAVRYMHTMWVVLGILATSSGAGDAVGWRTDGTGVYPDAEPPTNWSAESNIVWKTPMPAESNASPIVVGERLFVCADPAELICLSAADGRVLWTKSNHYFEMMTPEQIARAKQDIATGEAIKKTLAKANAAMNKVRRPLNQKLKEQKQKPDDAALAAEVERLKKQLEAAQAEVKRIKDELAPYRTYMLPDHHQVTGLSSPTPTSDGQHVYVLTALGTVGCYDLDGNRRWLRLVAKGPGGYGMSASPLLAGDKLLVQIANQYYALNVADGTTAWTLKSPLRYGSPVAARVGDVPVAVTANGEILRMADGHVLAKGLAKLTYNAPIVVDGVVYFVDPEVKAYRLPATAAEPFEPQPAWDQKVTINKDRYYASPVCADGLLYALNQKGILSVLDAKTGRLVYEQKLKLAKTSYPSLTIAGRYVFASADAGTTVVFEPGRHYREVAANRLERFRSTPVFVAKRLYIRGLKHLYCIGQ